VAFSCEKSYLRLAAFIPKKLYPKIVWLLDLDAEDGEKTQEWPHRADFQRRSGFLGGCRSFCIESRGKLVAGL
jgi:hypothetical protein